MGVVNNRHHESVFLIATVAPGSLPRYPNGNIDLFELRYTVVTIKWCIRTAAGHIGTALFYGTAS